MITIISSYYNRLEALKRWVDALAETEAEKIIISQDKSKEAAQYCAMNNVQYIEITKGELFNTGKCHNEAFKRASNDWVLKLDIDCIPSNKIMINYISIMYKEMRKDDFRIFGVVYLSKDEKHNKNGIGNEFLVHRDTWEKIGGSPEWEGYGWEDYAVAYKLFRNLTNKKITAFTEETITDLIKNGIVSCENLLYDNIRFLHYYHEKDFTGSEENRNKLYELVRKHEDCTC